MVPRKDINDVDLIGALGVWFHTEGKPAAALSVVTASLPAEAVYADSEEDEAPAVQEARSNAREGERTPPYLASLAFCGLGLFGILACSRRLPAEYDRSEPQRPRAAGEVAA